MLPKIKSVSSRIFNGVTIKLLITFILLWLILAKLELKEVAVMLQKTDPIQLALAGLLAIIAVILSAYKWQLLLAARGWKLSITALTKIYFVGLFMNNFLPSSIGGDAMRIYQVGKKINNTSESAASVILERVLATLGLAIPVLFALVPNRELLGQFFSSIIYFFIFCAALIFIIMKPSIMSPLKSISWKWWQNIIIKAREIGVVISSYRAKPRAILKVIFYSIIFQLTIVLINYCLVLGMGIEGISLWHCILMVPIISAVSMIPVSINGLGIREGAYILLFGPLGLSTSQAITLSMVFFFIVTVISLFGGLIFILEREKGDYVVTR